MTDARPPDDFAWRAQLVQNAAYVALEGAKRATLLQRSGGSRNSLVYVYDTNIVVGYCAPWRDEGDESSTHSSVGQILPPRPTYGVSTEAHLRVGRDEAKQAQAVAKLIMSHALRANGSGLPIYQLPAHFAETVDIYDAVRRRAEVSSKTTGRAVLGRADWLDHRLLALLKDMLQQPDGGLRDPDDRAWEVALAIARRIMSRWKSDNRATREWDSFYSLNVKEGGIFSTVHFMLPSDGPEAEVNMVVERSVKSPLSSYEEEAEKVLAEEIFSQISHRRATKPSNIEIDAKAVARLFLINWRLKASGQSNRVVLITSDRSLANGLYAGLSTKAKKAYELSPELALRIGRDHIHHPWSFVDEIANRGSGARSSDQSMGSTEFFSGLLAIRPEKVPDKLSEDWKNQVWDLRQDQLHEIYRGKEKVNLTEISDKAIELACKRWEEFTSHAVEANALAEIGDSVSVRRAIVRVVRNSIGRPGFDWAELQDEVDEVVLRARDRSNVTFSDIGADVLMAAKVSGKRNPPDLMFDSLANANLIFERLAEPKVIYESVQSFNEDFERITLDCHDSAEDQDDRQEIYLKYLVLGALVASAERWSVADEHAKNAINIIERARATGQKIRVKDGSAANMSGREAYFLRAVARRIRAVDQADIRRARELLQVSLVRFREDRAAGSGISIPHIRFDNENLAIALSSYYIARMADESNACNREFEGIMGRARVVLRQRNEMKENELRADVARGDRYSSVRSGTRVAIEVNLIQALVVRTFRRRRNLQTEEPPIREHELRAALEEIYTHCDIENKLPLGATFGFRRLPGEEPRSICSALIVRYASVGAQLLRDSRFWFPTSKQDVESLFNSDSNATTYDAWRFPMLREFSLASLD